MKVEFWSTNYMLIEEDIKICMSYNWPHCWSLVDALVWHSVDLQNAAVIPKNWIIV